MRLAGMSVRHHTEPWASARPSGRANLAAEVAVSLTAPLRDRVGSEARRFQVCARCRTYNVEKPADALGWGSIAIARVDVMKVFLETEFR
jgi:hypothetical protein